MLQQMSLFSAALVDCLFEQLKRQLQPKRMSFTEVDDTCYYHIYRGEREIHAQVVVERNAQVSLRCDGPVIRFSLNHPDAIDRIVEELTRAIERAIDPFYDESLEPELIRRLLVLKAIKTVEGRDDQDKQWIHAVVSQALNDLGLRPMRFPNSRRDQIRRAFLLLVGLESAPESSKASWMQEFQTASCELGTMRIDGTQITFNPYLLYRKLHVEKNLQKEVADLCNPFRSFVESESIDVVIEDWMYCIRGNGTRNMLA